ncbi:MAG: class I SAM-dependent methyltransferase [Patescibacteria group bacterium]|nr:class I SAM-dependent methyltransferase [Patescibacteria group bacterium]
MALSIIDELKRRLNLIGEKQKTELAFWKREIGIYMDWYEGHLKDLYGVPAPKEKDKIKSYSPEENAIRTWAKVDGDKYVNHLAIPYDYFKGMKLLDVGCGPIPYALTFTGCTIWGLDQLISGYKRLGFPLDNYDERLTYIQGGAENIPVEDNFFDAVISVNAIDHVDDFPKACKEIMRVLKPEGILRIETHYHEPTVCEPWVLTDKMIKENFKPIGIKKIKETKFADIYPEYAKSSKEKLVVWSNKS